MQTQKSEDPLFFTSLPFIGSCCFLFAFRLFNDLPRTPPSLPAKNQISRTAEGVLNLSPPAVLLPSRSSSPQSLLHQHLPSRTDSKKSLRVPRFEIQSPPTLCNVPPSRVLSQNPFPLSAPRIYFSLSPEFPSFQSPLPRILLFSEVHPQTSLLGSLTPYSFFLGISLHSRALFLPSCSSQNLPFLRIHYPWQPPPSESLLPAHRSQNHPLESPFPKILLSFGAPSLKNLPFPGISFPQSLLSPATASLGILYSLEILPPEYLPSGSRPQNPFFTASLKSLPLHFPHSFLHSQCTPSHLRNLRIGLPPRPHTHPRPPRCSLLSQGAPLSGLQGVYSCLVVWGPRFRGVWWLTRYLEGEVVG